MEREITYLIFDQSPTMAPFLDDCVDLALDLVLRSLMRGKKTDLFGIAKIHHPDTDNPMDNISPGNWNNCVLEGPEVYDWNLLAELKDSVSIYNEPVGDLEVDVPRALAIVLQRIAELNPKGTKKERNTIFLMSDMASVTNWGDLGMLVSSAAAQHNVLIVFVHCVSEQVLNQEPAQLAQIEANLEQIDSLLGMLRHNKGRTLLSYICTLDQMKNELLKWRNEPVRFWRPARMFTGDVRIGGDLESIDLRNCATTLKLPKDEADSFAGDYNSLIDPLTIRFVADAYPLTKSMKIPINHEMGLRKDPETGATTLFDLKHAVDKYVVLEADNEENAEKKIVQDTQVQEAYKYGASTVPITLSLKQLLKMNSYAGLDFLQFVDRSTIPPWYYHGEAEILLSNQNSTLRDQYAFNMLAQSMLEQDLVGIVRYVKKNGGPVKLAAMSPCVLLTESTKYRAGARAGDKRTADEIESEEEYYGFSLVMLPFSEEERVSTSVKLDGVYDGNSNDDTAKENFPTAKMVHEMDQLVESLDLDRLDNCDTENVHEYKYVELNHGEPFPLPHGIGLDLPADERGLNSVTRRILTQNGPNLHYVPQVLREIYASQVRKAEYKVAETRYETLFEVTSKDPAALKALVEQTVGQETDFAPSFDGVDTDQVDELCERLAKRLEIEIVPEPKPKREDSPSVPDVAKPSIDTLLASVLPS
ncbi:hypothetical protein OGAPHI_004033 [Ogataea philodendri]|uniref:DNA helicase n=1 Tax=Ogataea philodendri TaxID=1378263 RepID=A0A9P8P6B1_9ASCO|nr:uncharacterized protein OGAPHI_004033 [Ogataea philodendri]KAH3665845.1 hypothetical protein OGAPHI_004033 [Ogataea philodendri]